MVKLIFKIIWIVISILTLLLSLYFLFAQSGIETIKSIFSAGFLEGIKEFFVSIWDGFKATVGLS